MIYTITIVGWEDEEEDNNGSIEDSNQPIDVEEERKLMKFLR